jgi:hypothetical protein
MTVTEINATTGRVTQRQPTAQEREQLDKDRADAATRVTAEKAAQDERDKGRARAATLAGKARAGTLTAAERDEALTLALGR